MEKIHATRLSRANTCVDHKGWRNLILEEQNPKDVHNFIGNIAYSIDNEHIVFSID